MEHNIDDFFYTMYTLFGQDAVIHFVKDRQAAGQMADATWQDCDGCDWHSPFLDNHCLVCGEHNVRP